MPAATVPDSRADLIEIDLGKILAVIWRRKSAILSFVLLAFAVTFLVVSSLSPIYQASATLSVHTEKSRVATLEELYGFESASTEYIATQVEILRSRDMTERVIDKLRLDLHPLYHQSASPIGIGLNYFMDKQNWLASDSVQSTPSIDKEALIDQVIAGLSVAPVRKTLLIKVNFVSKDSALASRIANAYGDVYLESILDGQLAVTENAIKFLEGRLSGLQTRLRTSEENLQKYREKHNLVDVKGLNGLNEQELAVLASKLVDLRRSMAVAKTSYEQIQAVQVEDADRLSSLVVVQQNRIASELIVQINQLEQELQETSKRYKQLHPKMIAARSRLDSTRNNLDIQITRITDSIEKEYLATRSAIKLIEKDISIGKNKVQSTNRKLFKLRELEREVDTDRRIYDTFFQKIRDTEVTQRMDAGSTQFVQRASAPRDPIKPRKSLIYAISLAMILFVGLAMAFVVELFDQTVKTPDDLLNEFGVLPLAALPTVPALKSGNCEAIFNLPEHAAYSECIRTICTSVSMASRVTDSGYTVLVTSALPGEGKTTTSLNMALALSKIDKTAIVDIDLRRHTLSDQVSRSTKGFGIEDVINGNCLLAEICEKYTQSSLTVVPAGRSGEYIDAQLVLNSPKFLQMLEVLRKSFRFVVIDGAPVHVVSDSLTLAPMVDSVLFIVKAESTPIPVVKSVISRLKHAEGTILGGVLNEFDTSRRRYGYGYGYGGYGYTYDKYKV